MTREGNGEWKVEKSNGKLNYLLERILDNLGQIIAKLVLNFLMNIPWKAKIISMLGLYVAQMGE